MKFNFKQKNIGNKSFSQINVTPFVDVMLVLLIVFMITAPLLTVGVKVNLPKKDIYEGDQRKEIDELVMILMGKKPELRYEFIKNNANVIKEKI